jgi:hypothetical protein
MATGSSSIHSRRRGGRSRPDARLKDGRKARFRWLETEGLEPRTLLATIPAAVATGGAINLSGLSSVTTGGNANSPAVVVDPYDPQEVIAVWSVDLSGVTPAAHTTSIVEGAYSNDGGSSWTSLGTSVAPVQVDPANATAASPANTYTQVIDPSVGFDSQDHFYVLSLQETGAADGELDLTRFSFSGGAPVPQPLPNGGIVYQWVAGSDAATDPVLAVDAARPLAGTTPDPHANNVYIAWSSIDTEPVNPAPFSTPGFNPNRAELVVGTPVSNPQGTGETLAFSGVQTVNAGGNSGVQRDSHP